MAPIAISPEPEEVSYSMKASTKQPKASTPQWMTDLDKNGYAVLKNAIPRDRADSYRDAAHKWVSSFSSAFSFEDRSTWINANLPVQSEINTFEAYCVAHEKFMWDVRQEPGVVSPFAQLWGTDELLVSYDALNITFPYRADRKKLGSWGHVDQTPYRRGRCCVQGVVCLSPAREEDGGLVVYPGSHALTEEFFATQTDKATWTEQDYYRFELEQIDWFEERGCLPHKVCADVGDLILWDSRTVHYGSEPTEKSDQIRTVIYTAYTPAAWAKEEALIAKRQIFKNWGSTTHWPHENITPGDGDRAFLPDGSADPRDRLEPAVQPELTDKLLKLAGVMNY